MPNQPLKVLIFSPEPSVGGGVVEFGEVLKRHLSNTVNADWFITGLRPRLLGRMLRTLMPLYDSCRLAVRLMVERHDVYHLNPSLVPRSVLRDGLFLIVLRLFRRKRVLVFFRGWDPDCFRQIALSPVWRPLFSSVYRRAARLLVLGSPFATDLITLGFTRQNLFTLTTMFDGTIFEHVARRRNDDHMHILFLARFVSSKGIYELLEAFLRVSRIHPETILVMAGEGEEKQRASDWCTRHGLGEKVRFPGYVGGAEKAQLLVDSDIFVLPSYREGCPNALIEAMAAGLPAIVTPVGGIPDIVQDGIHGLLVPARSVDALERSIAQLIGTPALRDRMGRRNRKDAWQKYEASMVSAELEGHYRSLLGSNDG